MLERLDTVDWSKVQDAYGPATEVPALVRELTSKKAPERRKALQALSETVNHQGTITPAAVAVAPFLVEVALSPDTKDRGALLAFLANLAVGGNHIRYVTTGYETRDAAFENAPADFPYKVIYLAIDAAAPEVTKLLDHKEAGTRVGAAMLLAFLARHADSSAPAVRKRLGMETDAQAKASLLLSLGLLDKYVGTDADADLLTTTVKGSSGLVQVCAAIALAIVAPDRAGPEIEQALITGVSTPPDAGKDFPWCDGQIDNLAALALAGLVAHRHDAELASRLLAATAGKPSQTRVAGILLDAVFPDGDRSQSLRPRGEISDMQRGFLKQLIDGQLVFRLQGALARHGLLDRPADLSRYLGLVPQGPVDKEVAGRALFQIALDVVDGIQPEAAWHTALAGFSPEEVLAICEDAAAPPYMLALPWPAPQDRPWSMERQHKARLEHMLAIALRDRVPDSLLLPAADVAMAKTPPKRPFCAALAFALSEHAAKEGRTLDPALDPLVACGLDEGGHAADLRIVLERLPIERREAILAKASFLVSVKSLPTGQTVASLRGAWLLVDLCPTPATVDRAIADIVGWKLVYPAFEEQAADIFLKMGEVARARLAGEEGKGNTPLARIAARVLSAPAA